MHSDRRSLRERFPKRQDIPLVLGGASAALPLGLLLPTITLSKVGGLSEHSFSVVTGIIDLAEGGNLLLALVIFTFSFVFPIVKLSALWLIWCKRMDSASRARALHRLKVLGKWSMLDVFVVAVLVGAVRFGFLASATPRYGLSLFAGAVLLSMVATFLEFRLCRLDAEELAVPRTRSLASLPVGILALLLLGAGLALPLMEVKTWVFWKRDYSVLSATAALAGEGKILVTVVVSLFVVAIPLATLGGEIALVVVGRFREEPPRWAGVLAALTKWAMIDVFALGLLIVLVKIGSIADVSPRAGLACLLAGVFFSAATASLARSR